MPPADLPRLSELAPAPAGRLWFAAAVAALLAAAFCATFTRENDYDVFWHLASGEWMLQHQRVLSTDQFSVDPEPRWVNVHWLFQVIAASLHAVGGFGLLCAMKVVLASATILVLAVFARRRVPLPWMVICGLATLIVIETRVRVRPESFTLLMMMVAIVLIEGVRQGASPRRLWWLAPLMVAWVNMHGLYILGPALFWSAVLGAAVDRRGRPGLAGNLTSGTALAACAAATAACLISPWPVEAAAQPLLLWRRISGEIAYYTYTVSEFLPTLPVLHYHLPEAALAALAIAAVLANVRRVPIGHIIWLIAFAALGLMARRNMALLGPVCGYLLAVHGAAAIRRLPGAAATLWRRPGPRWAAAGLCLLLAGGVCFAYASEWVFRARGYSQQFGPGIERELYPIEIATYLRDLPADGDIYCLNWGDAAAFIYYSRPRRVFMDGRLEAHSLERFIQDHRVRGNLARARSAAEVAIHPRVRFIHVRNCDREHLTVLSQCPRFRLIRVDATGACFARMDWPEARPARPAALLLNSLPPGSNLADYDVPLAPPARMPPLTSTPRRWYAQNPPSLSYHFGSMLLWLGWTSPNARPDTYSPHQVQCTLVGLRYLTAARAERITPDHIATAMLAQACQQRALQLNLIASPAVPVDIPSARALRLYQDLDLRDLRDPDLRVFALQRVDAMVRARQLDSAERAAQELLDRLPAPLRVHPQAQYTELRERIGASVRDSRLRAELIPPSGSALRRADALTAPDMGLIEQAIAELRAGEPLPPNRLMLGDLLLRQGRAEDARRQYEGLELPQAGWELPFRRALCDWVDGRLFEADAAMASIGRTDNQPVVRYYHALLLEEIGLYRQALEAVRGLEPPDEYLATLVDQLRRRLVAQ